MDGLDHHHRVVDDETDRDGHAAEGHEVERARNSSSTAQAHSSDAGMVIAASSVTRPSRRNRKITSADKTAPIRMRVAHRGGGVLDQRRLLIDRRERDAGRHLLAQPGHLAIERGVERGHVAADAARHVHHGRRSVRRAHR